MNFDQVISGRRAVRKYTTKTIDEAVIRDLIDCAVMAPNAINEQPWAFTVIRDQALLDTISNESKQQMLEVKHGGLHPDHLHTSLDDPSSHIFYHAPALILISARSPSAWIVQDCALAAENLMLAAYDRGLGSCWIGLAQSLLNSARGKELVQLPDNWVPVAPIIVGYPAHFPPATEREDPEIRWIN